MIKTMNLRNNKKYSFFSGLNFIIYYLLFIFVNLFFVITYLYYVQIQEHLFIQLPELILIDQNGFNTQEWNITKYIFKVQNTQHYRPFTVYFGLFGLGFMEYSHALWDKIDTAYI